MNFKEERVIITPHIGEMQRLSGLSIKDLKDAPITAAKNLAKEMGCICVLKDARTVVSDGNRDYINVSGNSGMATAGSGDVLTGVIAGMVGNGLSSYEAACMGVFAHGRAGDAAAIKYGTYGMKAMDIAEMIPEVLVK